MTVSLIGKKHEQVLIVTALAGFIRSFLMSDIEILQSMGYEVHCAANAHHPGANNVIEYLETRGVIYHQVDFSSNKPISRMTLSSFRQLMEIAKTHEFALVHCHTPISGVITRVVFRSRRKLGTKVLYTTHGFYFHSQSSKKSWMLYYPVEDLCSRWTDTMITINKEDYGNALKMHCADVRYVPGVGVDIDKFHNTVINRNEYRRKLGLSPDEFVILSVGEISARKNQRVVVEALGKLSLKKAVFIICGNCISGDQIKEELSCLSKRLNVDIRFMGRRNDIPQICKCADVGVLPSTREGLGLAGIEMIAAGLPLIGSNVHGIPDYLKNGINGLLCSPFDSSQWADAILKLKTNAELYAKISINGYRTVSNFSLVEAHSRMSDIYKSVLSH